MALFQKGIATYLDDENMNKLAKVKVGIAGAGGLGSNCAFNLVRSGFRQFVIVDFDVVEASNLNRQFYFVDQIGIEKVTALRENLLRINPELEIEIHVTKIVSENVLDFFADCDVVVEALDNAAAKSLVVNSYLKSGKLVVAASGLAGWGNSDAIKVRKINDEFYLVGDMVSEVGANCPPMSPRVNIAAAKQADVILSWVMEKK